MNNFNFLDILKEKLLGKNIRYISYYRRECKKVISHYNNIIKNGATKKQVSENPERYIYKKPIYKDIITSQHTIYDTAKIIDITCIDDHEETRVYIHLNNNTNLAVYIETNFIELNSENIALLDIWCSNKF